MHFIYHQQKSSNLNFHNKSSLLFFIDVYYINMFYNWFEIFLEMSEKVILSVYDITMGMAKNMSMAFIGQQVDAVYHTSLVVYGK